MLKMNTMNYKITIAITTILIAGCGGPAQNGNEESSSKNAFEDSITHYLELFPYQETNNYVRAYTGGDPTKLNDWSFGVEPVLVKAGEDKVVRMNNDTYYKFAFLQLNEGPVIIESSYANPDRFSSFQLIDDHNVNFKNIIRPDGKYVFYFGERPSGLNGQFIKSPSSIMIVGVRVEVKNKNDDEDVMDAKKVMNGLTISGPMIDTFPSVDLLSGFSQKVVEEAEKRMKETYETSSFSKLVAGTGDVPEKVTYLQLAAGTKYGWGGPVISHSSYQTFMTDINGQNMKGENGTYTTTFEAPPVDAFWSITAYDTDRGGFFHPNKDDRYHINNTTAVANDDGSYTFVFKTSCNDGDKNCLEVPQGRFDFAARYYLPKEQILSGGWQIPKATLKK